MLREDRDGPSSLVEVEDRHPVVGDQSLELPRENLEQPAGLELERHRASPRRDGGDDAAHVELSFRHAIIIRLRCRDQLRSAPGGLHRESELFGHERGAAEGARGDAYPTAKPVCRLTRTGV
jgi:hypothetical protein